jgi:hypothetical protein
MPNRKYVTIPKLKKCNAMNALMTVKPHATANTNANIFPILLANFVSLDRIFGSSGIPGASSQKAQAAFGNININHEVISDPLIDNLEKSREFRKNRIFFQ